MKFYLILKEDKVGRERPAEFPFNLELIKKKRNKI